MDVSVYTVRDESGDEVILRLPKEEVKSKVNAKILWRIDFRPFRKLDTEESVYLADNPDLYEFHKQDEEFISNYEPVILHNDQTGQSYCNDFKLPSGRWMESVTVEEYSDVILVHGLIDAYGTYDEQR